MAATIVIADDHPLFRDALGVAARRASPEAAIVEASTVTEAISLVHSEPETAAILLDLWMPDSQGFFGLAQLKSIFPQIPIIVITAADHPEAEARALDYGASGFVSKSSQLSEIEAAIRSVLNGGRWPGGAPAHAVAPSDPFSDMAKRIASLTPAQLKVLQGVQQGRLNKQIAHEMDISEATVKAHMTAVFKKLGVANRTQAVLAARALELADPKARV